LLTQRLGDASLAQTLAGGLSGVIAAEIAPDLWAMAQTLRAAGLAAGSHELPPAAALAALRDKPAAAPFLAQLARFLQRHGHRCMVEAELLYPRWVEAPATGDPVAGALSGDAVAPAAVNADAARRREEATAQVERRGSGSSAGISGRRWRGCTAFTRLRDNGQHYVVKLLLPMRRLYAELGRAGSAAGWPRRTTSSSWWRRN
jgi:hypothetical protein